MKQPGKVLETQSDMFMFFVALCHNGEKMKQLQNVIVRCGSIYPTAKRAQSPYTLTVSKASVLGQLEVEEVPLDTII